MELFPKWVLLRTNVFQSFTWANIKIDTIVALRAMFCMLYTHKKSFLHFPSFAFGVFSRNPLSSDGKPGSRLLIGCQRHTIDDSIQYYCTGIFFRRKCKCSKEKVQSLEVQRSTQGAFEFSEFKLALRNRRHVLYRYKANTNRTPYTGHLLHTGIVAQWSDSRDHFYKW